MRLNHWHRLTLMVVAFLTAPLQVAAHAVNTGFGPFYDGLAHLFLTPEDLLPLLALTLLAALHGPRFGRTVLIVLPGAWLAGAIAGSVAATQVSLGVLPSLLLIALGVLTAADRALPLRWIAGLALMLGTLHGYLNGAALDQAQLGALGLAGTVAAVFAMVSLLGGQVVSLRTTWARIAVRVAGSWLAAIGLLMAGWSFRG